MNNALIGFSGFVGSTLLKQAVFNELYRSSNIADIEGRVFNEVVCAGAPAKKWIANNDPEADRRNIDNLINHLKAMQCEKCILISTIDVFKNPIGVDESTAVDECGLHAYGLNRRRLEKFVSGHFAHYLIVRLPGLVGPGLRKNIIFDLLNNNNLQAIDSRGVYQFYPMVNLWFDLQTAQQAGLKLIHLAGAPISVADVAKKAFGMAFERELSGPPATYDMRTQYAALFGASGNYQYSFSETIQAIRAYAQSEPHTLASDSRKQK
ncbi:NAD(P)-dependent oxidoreductase [Acerihabitans arboris]|uniref:Pyridine nucleotide transhydrogenase n=1 Tax=Acerihabitans arboris TaxID=2691583 RepID=A0A845SPN4_9GAMM|nr:NAD(P)-dependent oxidoreductase [Acerihabitans arboris]NDL63135.1 pyridine nucleotide transhydrogenase [Acerihabitans arboris]